MRLRWIAPLVLAAAAVMAGVLLASSREASAPAAAATRLGCARQSSFDFRDAFGDRRNRVVGPLVLVGGATFTDAATARDFGGNTFQLLVRAGHTVTVSARGSAAIAYGPLTERRAITFVACSAKRSASSAPEPVTLWSGFVTTPDPACVRLDVRVDDEPASRPVTLELGRRCAKPPPLRGCAEHVEGPKPSTTTAVPGDVAVGPLRFRGLADIASRRSFEIDNTGAYYGVKSGVGVPAGMRATLSIGRSARSWASLTYGPRRPGQPDRVDNAVRFQACAAEHPAFSYDGPVGPVTGFSGGFRLKRAGCVPLEVRVAGRPTVRKTIAFGVRRCD